MLRIHPLLVNLVKHHIPFTNTTAQLTASLPSAPTNTLELKSTTLRIQKQNVTFINIYIPPSSSTQNNFQLNTLNNLYILGDFNAYDPAWLTTQVSDNRGDAIINQLPNLIILNNTLTSTRKPSDSNTSRTSPLRFPGCCPPNLLEGSTQSHI